MAKPVIVEPGIPDLVTPQGDAVTVNTSDWWSGEAPPANYELTFNSGQQTFAVMPVWDIRAGDTVEFDINLAKLDTYSASVIDQALSANFNIVLRASSGRPRLTFKNTGGTQYNLDISLTMTPGVSRHVKYTFGATSIEVDVDGQTNTINETPDYDLMIPIYLSSNNGGVGVGGFNGVLKNLVMTGSDARQYAINDGPGSTQFIDSVGGQHMTQQNIVPTDWAEV